MKKQYIFSIFITCAAMLFSCQKSLPTFIKLQIQLENAPFDSLFIYYYSDSTRVAFKGQELKKHLWEFVLPDKVLENFEFLRLTCQFYNQQNNLFYAVRFYGESNRNKNYFNGFILEDNIIHNNIHAKYNDQGIFNDQMILDFNTDGEPETIITDVVSFNFEVLNKDDDIYIMSQQPFFSYFIDPHNENKTYDDFLKDYTALSKKYPDSKYLIIYLSENLLKYRNKDDIRAIYNNLSNKYKKTRWGNYIEQFLDSSFENTILLTLDRKNSEAIVTDSSKLNLVVFTASWCPPCREEIPLLKEIYNDLKSNLIITYVSIDEEKTIGSFQNLMQKENIPWRALLAFQDYDSIKKKYFIDNGIPHGILVYPNGKMDVIDVRDDTQREKLYSLCSQSK